MSAQQYVMSQREPASHEFEWMGQQDREDEPRHRDEDQREREWHELEALARDFVKTYGGAAMIRCVSEALK